VPGQRDPVLKDESIRARSRDALALLHRGQPVFYLSGIAVNRASAGYRGGEKTDAKDARLSPTKPGCDAICASCTCLTMTLCGCGC
jgi:hypothetical protein